MFPVARYRGILYDSGEPMQFETEDYVRNTFVLPIPWRDWHKVTCDVGQQHLHWLCRPQWHQRQAFVHPAYLDALVHVSTCAERVVAEYAAPHASVAARAFGFDPTTRCDPWTVVRAHLAWTVGPAVVPILGPEAIEAIVGALCGLDQVLAGKDPFPVVIDDKALRDWRVTWQV